MFLRSKCRSKRSAPTPRQHAICSICVRHRVDIVLGFRFARLVNVHRFCLTLTTLAILTRVMPEEKLAACSLVWQRVAAHHAEEPSSLLGDLIAAGDPHRLELAGIPDSPVGSLVGSRSIECKVVCRAVFFWYNSSKPSWATYPTNSCLCSVDA